MSFLKATDVIEVYLLAPSTTKLLMKVEAKDLEIISAPKVIKPGPTKCGQRLLLSFDLGPGPSPGPP